MKTYCLFIALILNSVSAWASSFMPSSFSANYVESLKSISGKEKKSYGKIDYKYPGHIRLEVSEPDPSTFVSNPDKSWYYTPPFVQGEQGQVTIQRSSKLPLTKFLDSIKKGIEGSKLFTAKHQGNDLVLTFKKASAKELSLKEVVLHAKKDAKTVKTLGEFESLTLVYEDGRKVELKFIDFKEDVSFDGNHFEFKVPPKTKVTTN